MANEWRSDPRLKDRFHPQHPDDCQVIVHGGGPRVSSVPPELVWVTVTGRAGDAFRGRLLNQPHRLPHLCIDNEILFLTANGAPHPILVTPRYLSEREDWQIHPCNRCGFSELFDAPSELMRATFPKLSQDGEMAMFTTFCALCGGVQSVERPVEEEGVSSAEHAPQRPWWKFWER